MLPWMTYITSTVSHATRYCEFIELLFTCHTFLRGTDHCAGQPELSRAGNSSGMLSPSADRTVVVLLCGTVQHGAEQFYVILITGVILIVER